MSTCSYSDDNFDIFSNSYEKLVTGSARFHSDGLNSLKYKLKDFQLKPLYTWIYVDITPETVSVRSMKKSYKLK